jgi:hypothetical protein
MSGYKPEAKIVELIVGRDDQVQLAHPSDDLPSAPGCKTHRDGSLPELLKKEAGWSYFGVEEREVEQIAQLQIHATAEQVRSPRCWIRCRTP